MIWIEYYIIIFIKKNVLLISQLKYKKLRLDIGLIIHDECNSISNNSTKQFYDYILNKYPKIKCILELLKKKNNKITSWSTNNIFTSAIQKCFYIILK